MAFQSVPRTCQITVAWSINGQPLVNTFYAFKGEAYTAADIDDVAAAVDLWVDSSLKPILGAETTYVRTEVRGLENEEDFLSIVTTNSGLCGVTSASVPNQVCFAMKRNSGLTGRSARGRVYMPIMQVVLASNENTVSSTFAEALRDALNALRIVLLALEWIESIVSRYNEGVKREVGINFAVTGYDFTDLVVDTQRGRLH
jgi:hypothetical protein